MFTPDFFHFLIIFLIGIISGTSNVVAEGGSVIALPALMLLGYTGVLANGTNRQVLFILNLFALRTFYNREQNDFDRSLRYAWFAIPGSIIGTLLVIEMDDARYKLILGVMMLAVAIPIFFMPDLRQHQRRTAPEWIICGMMFFIGMYGGFAQAGVAIFLTIVLTFVEGMNNIRSSIYKVFLVFAYLFPTSLMLIWTGHVDWPAAFVLLIGVVTGSWIGEFSLFKSNQKIMRLVLFVLVIIMGLKLLKLF